MCLRRTRPGRSRPCTCNRPPCPPRTCTGSSPCSPAAPPRPGPRRLGTYTRRRTIHPKYRPCNGSRPDRRAALGRQGPRIPGICSSPCPRRAPSPGRGRSCTCRTPQYLRTGTRSRCCSPAARGLPALPWQSTCTRRSRGLHWSGTRSSPNPSWGPSPGRGPEGTCRCRSSDRPRPDTGSSPRPREAPGRPHPPRPCTCSNPAYPPNTCSRSRSRPLGRTGSGVSRRRTCTR